MIQEAYELARKKYEGIGVDVEKAMDKLKSIPISVHCWQGDDVGGFERPNATLSGGGIQATGNYPGKARTIKELRQDLEKVFSLVPGSHRLALQASYGEFGSKFVDRNEIRPEHFQGWIDWAKKNNLKLDFNCTLFSHPKANEGFTLSSKNKDIRNFWIEHVRRCREISAEIGKQLGSACVHNIWIPDGIKDIPVDRAGYRLLLIDSLDKILEKKYSPEIMEDSVEGKLFGIGSESYVVGSHEFYLSYAVENNTLLTIDTGHFHQGENVADKISAILPFVNGIFLHISRGIRWDSDHVAILSDDLIQLMQEIVRNPDMDRVRIALDYFDASINRVGAYVIGIRAAQKALLFTLLEPWKVLRNYEEQGKNFQRLATLEELKTFPYGAVWDYFCYKNNVPVQNQWISEVEQYEQKIQLKRF